MDWLEKINIDLLLRNYQHNNYFIRDRSYELNVFGVRANTPANNQFDDCIGGLRLNHGNQWEVLICKATTDPGFYWLEHPMNVKGTAILVPGQYIGSHKTGLHHNYKALIQCGKMKFYRDRNKDDTYDFDPDTIEESVIGCNVHRAGTDSTLINKWSAACQVIAKLVEYEAFMSLVNDHLEKGYPDLFDYTLLEEKNLIS